MRATWALPPCPQQPEKQCSVHFRIWEKTCRPMVRQPARACAGTKWTC